MPPTGNPGEFLRKRKLAAKHGPPLEAALRARVTNVPLEVEVEPALQPVDDEDAHLYVRTDGLAVLKVQGIANDLVHALAEAEGVRFAARVWPRTIWCRKSQRRAPREHTGAAAPPVDALLYSERDARGNTRLCLANSHGGEHDFSE